jgi:hypothetical protein
MSRQQKDISITEIDNLLHDKQDKLLDMENMTKKDREKLKKINDKLDKQEHDLINIVSDISTTQADVSEFEDFNEDEDKDFSKSIRNVLDNLRKIRNSLADIIRKE